MHKQNVISKSHFSITSTQEIKNICNRFFSNNLNCINHLNYIQKNADGTVFYLCTNAYWLEHYYSNNYPSVGAFEQNDSFDEMKYVSWSTLSSDDKVLIDSKELISVEHGITLIDKFDGVTSYYNFGSNDNDPMLMNRYISNLDVLNQFKEYFQNEAKKLIVNSMASRIIIPKNTKTPLKIYNNVRECKNYLPKKGLKRYYVDRNVFLTAKEMECIEWYLKGKNSVEIATILCVSKRTVETHIENIKFKLGCRSLFQLGYILAKIKQNYLGYIPLK